MQIATEGIEDARIPLAGVPTGANISASTDRLAWAPVAATLDASGNGSGTVLIAGKDAKGYPDGTPVVPVSGTELWVRIINGPEVVIRSAGAVTFV